MQVLARVAPRVRLFAYDQYISALVLAYGLLGVATVHAQTIPLLPERLGHAETLLPSGQVLITGGQNENATLDSALLYDPATGSFVATGALITAREEHTSTLLPDGTVLIAGGEKDKVALQTAEIYDRRRDALRRYAEA